MANSIFPPVLPSKQYSFLYNSGPQYPGPSGNNDYFMTIQFEMPATTKVSEIGHVQVSLRYVDTNISAIQEGCSPDRGTLFISATNNDWSINAGSAVAPVNPYFRRTALGSNIWEINVPFRVFDGGVTPSTNYAVQVRFGIDDLWAGASGGAGDYGLTPYIGYGEFAGWRTRQVKAVPSNFGEWSNQTTIFCYERPGLEFESNFHNFVPQINWTYDPKSDDPIAQIEMNYTYQDMEGSQTISKQFSGTTSDSNKFVLSTYLDVAPWFPISGTITALTQNNTRIVYPFSVLSIMLKDVADKEHGIYTVWDKGKVTDKVLVGEENNDGILAKTLIAEGELSENDNKTVSVYRCNLLSLKTVKVVDKMNLIKDQKASMKDYTVEMGERYEYVFCIMDSENKLDQFFISPTPYGKSNPGYGRLMSMEALYLTNRNHQLRCIGNLNISNFKSNTTDGFQTTIGAQFPYYSRNSKNDYRTLQVSCVVSINFDPTSVFMRLDPSNGLFWDEGIDSSHYVLNGGDAVQLMQLKKELIDLQTEYDTWVAKLKGSQYYTDPSVHQQVNYNLAKYDALIQQKKAQIEVYAPTRGATSLYILDEDLYEFDEISLSRRRMMQRSTGGETLEQELSKPPYGVSELATGDYTDVNGNDHTSGFLRGAQSIYSPFLHKEAGITYDTSNSERMIYLERKFRDKVMKWLSDGKPKLLRSEHEGNMIVILTNASFTPLQATGRKVYTVTFTATEIAEYNLENLIDYNLIPSVIENDYSEVNILDFNPGEPDPNVNFTLAWSNLDLYNVPNAEIGKPIVEIPLSLAIINNLGTIDQLRIGFTNKPAWLTAIIRDGILYLTGTPTVGDISDPITMEVTALDTANPDSTSNRAVGQLTVGTVYLGIAINALPSQPSMKVGDELTPIDVSTYTVGGVGTKIWYATNLPYGFTIDPYTGIISGTAAEECPDGKTSVILVRDEDGNMAQEPLVFDHIGSELYLAGQGLYSIPISEVGIGIDSINLGPNASGGSPFIGPLGDPLYSFSMTNAPAGITIDQDTGIISGVPTTANSSATLATVTVTDSIGDQRSIDINVEQVLPAFEIQPYEYDPTAVTVGGLRTYHFRMTSGGNTTPGTPMVMQPIPVGDMTSTRWTWIINNPDGIVENSVTLPASIKGGLPFEKTNKDGTITKYYELIGEGFLPNFKLDRITGEVTGMPTVGMNQHEAIVRIRDRRGLYARDPRINTDYIRVTISQIVSTMTVIEEDASGNPYTYRLPETSRQNKKISNGRAVENIPAAEYKIVFPLNRVKNAQFNGGPNNSHFEMVDFPQGFQGQYDSLSNSYIITMHPSQVTGGPNELTPAVGRMASLYIKDDTLDTQGVPQKVAIPIYIGTIYDWLSWKDSTQITSYFCGDDLNKMFSGLGGGKAPYKFRVSNDSYLPPGITLFNPEATHFGISGFQGTFSNVTSGARNVRVTLQDALGQEVSTVFNFGRIFYHLSASLNTATDAAGISLYHRMSNYNFIVGLTSIPTTGNILRPLIVTGGSDKSNYRYSLLTQVGDKNPLGGLAFVNGQDGLIAGSVTSTVESSENLKGILQIEDIVSGEKIVLDIDCYTARCWLAPDNKGGTVVNVTGLTAMQSINSALYQRLIDPQNNPTVTSDSQNLIAGILFNNEQNFELSGKPLVATNGIKRGYIYVYNEENPWTPKQQYSRPVDFGVVSNLVSVAMNDKTLPVFGIGDSFGMSGYNNAVIPLVISLNGGSGGQFGGGVQPYTWTVSYYNNLGETVPAIPGMGFAIGANGTSITMTGTATGQVRYSGKIKLRVTDANGSYAVAEIKHQGVYPKLRLTNSNPINIPAAYGGIDIAPIILTSTGGEGSYSYHLSGAENYGYKIGGANRDRIVGPPVLTSVPTGTGRITVTDSVGQTASVNVNFGAITGQLSFNTCRVTTAVPSGAIGTPISNISFAGGVEGGKSPQTWTMVSKPSEWTALTLNSVGVLSGIRPATPMAQSSCIIRVSDDTKPEGITFIVTLGAVV